MSKEQLPNVRRLSFTEAMTKKPLNLQEKAGFLVTSSGGFFAGAFLGVVEAVAEGDNEVKAAAKAAAQAISFCLVYTGTYTGMLAYNRGWLRRISSNEISKRLDT